MTHMAERSVTLASKPVKPHLIESYDLGRMAQTHLGRIPLLDRASCPGGGPANSPTIGLTGRRPARRFKT